MNPLLYALPFDPHGDSVNNRITGELHDLNRQARSPYRVIVLEKGHFYKKDLVVREATGRELVLDEDYQITGMSGEAAHITGQIACSVIVIINPKVKALISVDAQMVGGKFIQVDTAIGQMAAGVINNTRSVWWKNIEGRPDAFTPNGHLHALWEIYGFDEWIAQLHRMVEAILLKSRLAYASLDLDQTHQYELLQDALDKLHNRLLAHLNNRNNPHKVTATQIGLEQLANFGIATEAEARAIGETITNKYMTVLRTAQHIDSNFVRALNDHIASLNNPHKVTYTQLDTLSSLQIVALMGRLLGLHETAVATSRLNGRTYQELYYISRSNLDTSYLAQQRMSLDRFGLYGRDRSWALRGDGAWVTLQSVFDAYSLHPPSVLYMSGIQSRPGISEGLDQPTPEGVTDSTALAMANINAIYSDIRAYGIGTVVICRQHVFQNNGTGNGGFYTTPYGLLFTAVRTPAGWTN